jgi:pilus assembly protein CpaC
VDTKGALTMSGRCLLLLLCCAIVMPGRLALGQDAPANEPQRLRLTIGRSQVMDVPFEVKRVSVGDPEIADVVVLTPHQLYVLGKGTGVTNLLVQGKDQQQMILDLLVEADLTLLKEKLHTLLPKEAVEVYPAKDGILLKGEVSSNAVLATVLSLAEPFAPKKVVNLMQVGGLQQVLLEVRVAEISRSALNELRFNYHSFVNDLFFGFTNIGGALGLTDLTQSIPDSTVKSSQFSIAPNTNLILGFPTGHITAFIEALQENGLVKILAEPNLMAVSGQEASFLAGGEFPVPVPQAGAASNAITVQFKKFGVQLNFVPTVLDSGKISLTVSPEVSELDFSTAIQVSGFVIPGLSTRSASTTVELMDGHTLAIAGLIRDDARNLIDKFPVLGDIPILGALFRSTSFQKNQSELLILVSPHLVKSLGSVDTVALPTDRYPDYERELVGLGSGKGGTGAAVPVRSGGLEGEFGHSN